MAQRKHHFQKLAAALGIFACCAAILATKQSVYAKDGIPESEYASEVRGMSAFQITKDMKAGWNLGNSLESDYNETYWGNPTITKPMIDAIAAKGFRTLRVPTRWDDNYSDPSSYTISKDYMDRVEEVVNYGLSNGMYVILNVHHNDLQTKASADWQEKENIKNELRSIWTQIATRFQKYGDRLIFEVNNEPRSGEDWTGNSEFFRGILLTKPKGIRTGEMLTGKNCSQFLTGCMNFLSANRFLYISANLALRIKTTCQTARLTHPFSQEWQTATAFQASGGTTMFLEKAGSTSVFLTGTI